MSDEDEVIASLTVRYSNKLPLHLHQFPLLTRPLQVPPSAAAAGKRISARIKPNARKLEVHVPADTRPEVWNSQRGLELGAAQQEDDREKNQEQKGKEREAEPRLSEIRLTSEEIVQKGAYMLGIVRDDVLSRKNRRRGVDSDSDSDDGPPPDPDEPASAPVPKKEKKSTSGETREIQVSARKADDKGGLAQLSAVRREMLAAIRAEEDEEWAPLQFSDVTTLDSEEAFENLFSQNSEELACKSDLSTFLKDIKGFSMSMHALGNRSDECNFTFAPSQDLSPQSQSADGLPLAIQTIMHTTVPEISEDSRRRGLIVNAGNTIITFLNTISALRQDRQALIPHYLVLMQSRFLAQVFTQRKYFRRIATKELLHDMDDSSTVVLSWCDVLLAKLSDVTILLVGESDLEKHPNTEAAFLMKQQEQDSLMAASQLPG
ncbi:hypothetical protein VNI00_001462 [Paramarasmius palmivorus]|uniref:Uncharacterized protein n=1 Tax=Paramarasmius palmivorus TaxID=297713 RepID=A0AAW0E0Z5_9AGAR